ncbi:MAG: class I SAM-dependent methyltransferase [Verrucomicrobiota bacterium]
MKHAQDHFSSIATQYALGRIGYPEDLFRFLEAQCGAHDLAWDCATGSGQAAQSLARTFSRVIATDISKELLALASPHPRISYRVASAEESGIESGSVNLVTVAQALHWFDLDRFWPEAVRVLKPGGVLAFWGYNWAVIESGVDRVLEEFKAEIASSWPERSRILHEGYISTRTPFREFASPAFEASAQWELEDYLAHLRSWSAVRYYRERTGEDAVKQFQPAFVRAWRGGRVTVKWPLILRVFRNV